MAQTVRLPPEADSSLAIIANVEKVTKQDLIGEAVNLLIKQRLEDPEFRKKLKNHLQPLNDLIDALEL